MVEMELFLNCRDISAVFYPGENYLYARWVTHSPNLGKT